MTAEPRAVAAADEVTRVARDYYDSGDADGFYHAVWGGEDIHIGIYERDDEPIFDASRRTVAQLADLLPSPGPATRVLDVGSGYGGAARWLARRLGCQVRCLNLSVTQNQRNRALNREQGLDHLVSVVDGAFEAIPEPDASFDVVWSQDALLHSGQKHRVLREVARVLRPGGTFVFTDPMQDDACPPGVLEPILARIHLRELGSPGFYVRAAAEAGFASVDFLDRSAHLVRHYARVGEELERRREALLATCSAAYLDRMSVGLRHWVEAGQRGHLRWGLFRARRDGGGAR